MGDGFGTAQRRYANMHRSYDDVHRFGPTAVAAVDLLAELAGDGPVLELAVGTGRLAIPLAGKGCRVTGLDASPDMLRVLRDKDTEGLVHTVLGDMAEPPVTGEFTLIYLVYNGLYELLTQEDQLRCLTAATRLLTADGRLVLETTMPNQVFDEQRPIWVPPMDEVDEVELQAMAYDPVAQTVQYRHISLATDSIRVLSSTHRYIYLPELDLMARLAGLELAERYQDWFRTPYQGRMCSPISVFRRARG